MYILALHRREVGGHLLFYVLGSFFFSLKGEWFPSEGFPSLIWFPILPPLPFPFHSSLSCHTHAYPYICAILHSSDTKPSAATFPWYLRDSVSHGPWPKVLLRNPAVGATYLNPLHSTLEKQDGAGGNTRASLVRRQTGSSQTCDESDAAPGRLVGNELGFPGSTEREQLCTTWATLSPRGTVPFSTSAVL